VSGQSGHAMLMLCQAASSCYFVLAAVVMGDVEGTAQASSAMTLLGGNPAEFSQYEATNCAGICCRCSYTTFRFAGKLRGGLQLRPAKVLDLHLLAQIENAKHAMERPSSESWR
jgi:hypothetical protein